MVGGLYANSWGKNANLLNKSITLHGRAFSTMVLNHSGQKLVSCCHFKENIRTTIVGHRRDHSLRKSSLCQSFSVRRRITVSFPCQNMTSRGRLFRQDMHPMIKSNCGRQGLFYDCAVTILVAGLFVCFSSSNEVHAKTSRNDDSESHSPKFSHGKRVYVDYSVYGIPGDGRCLFRSVVHGASLRSGKPAPNETLQRELADELRTSVADEFINRREEVEWFIEGDFDTYVARMRKPHTWGGEPELLMASHVLRMPISVYMYDKDAGGLICIAEYSQEHGKDNPIRVLYHGFGHYDALQIPRRKANISKL